MDTTNKTGNRVQCYLSPSVYEAFREYCQKERLNQSKAMDKILSTFFFEKGNIDSLVYNNQDQIKHLESRLSELEAIIKTKDYLEKAKIDSNSIKVTNQDMKKSSVM
ncbi:MAG: hypothetical protein QNJ37_16855 [Crocosphaera sp.]|nr:hypothetical protein [Crocosphaera sp.]